jgi:hypothetical protein
MRSVSGLPPIVLDSTYEARLHREAHGQRQSLLCALCSPRSGSPEQQLDDDRLSVYGGGSATAV